LVPYLIPILQHPSVALVQYVEFAHPATFLEDKSALKREEEGRDGEREGVGDWMDEMDVEGQRGNAVSHGTLHTGFEVLQHECPSHSEPNASGQCFEPRHAVHHTHYHVLI
jgi:hypothetical protein